jgi:hypothetical protein
MRDDIVHTYRRRLGADERADAIAGREISDLDVIERDGDRRISITTLDALMSEFARLRARDTWREREWSDRWLAPRVHYALRLSRTEASDRGVWQWIALRYSDYVNYRWTTSAGTIIEDRWWGPIHKQAFGRLWWGAELFRNGADYRPVERAFIMQDLPNSYLHRPLVRCRSLALAVVSRLAPDDTDRRTLSADQINDLARVLNLATAGAPPEIETGFQADDYDAFARWSESRTADNPDWDSLPAGPASNDTSAASLEGGGVIVARGAAYARIDT